MRPVVLAIGLTFALGISLAAAYYVVGGREALQGTYVLKHSWPAIYTVAALFAAVVTAPIGYVMPLSGRLVLVLMGAWFGEYLVLASGVLADELNPGNAVVFWIVATGGPVQLVAAYVGALAGRWLAQRRAARA